MEPAPDLWARVNARIADEPSRRASAVWLRAPIAAGAPAVLVAAVCLSMIHFGSPTPSAHVIKQKPAAVALVPPERATEPSVPSTKAPQPVSDKQPGINEKPRAKRPLIAFNPRPARVAKPKPPMVVASAPIDTDRLIDRSLRKTAAETRLSVAAVNLDKSFAIGAPLGRVEGKAAIAADAAVADTSSVAHPASVPAKKSAIALSSASETPSRTNTDLTEADATTNRLACSSSVGDNKDGNKSVVDALNETEGVRTAAIFAYP